MEKLLSLRAERRRREARRETLTTELVTTRRSILGPPAEGRPGPSDDDGDDYIDFDDDDGDDFAGADEQKSDDGCATAVTIWRRLRLIMI